MMEGFVTYFFYLMFGHALADYALQTDFIARGKNWNTPIPGVPWYYIMAAHSLIHAGLVATITGSVTLGLVEFALHFGIDCLKCAGLINIHADQGAHVACKAAYLLV